VLGKNLAEKERLQATWPKVSSDENTFPQILFGKYNQI
jgi:hypothetical protein